MKITALSVLAADLSLSERYFAAVSIGANETRSDEAHELTHSPTKLLALAINRVPDLGIYAHLIQSQVAMGVDPRTDALMREVVAAMRHAAAGALRLTHRALQVHSRNVGYDLELWQKQSTDLAEDIIAAARVVPVELDVPTPTKQIRDATVSLTRATVALESDRMSVPGHIAEAAARLLVLFCLADQLHT